ncbi:TonB-dependent receptor [Campylobacter sp. FMV-PI01]|uniref:TonB-dependent receptor n=1 Tax=Campylobacter portucalensis TaxID=2608384 RepID=A0A6L5WI24_9BACT|nr:TonB-dependent receptor [Campylobacter portucalensis]MSN96850.1 TonB-dependent receptor [Campylobacter portucalensis]
MNKFFKLSIISCLALNLMHADEIEFDNLKISAKEIKDDDKSFVTPGAVSSRGGVGSSTQSIDSIIRSMPGSYTNTDQTQGTIQVNIRGMTGVGRVNTMVDGVTQTFFGTSADNGKFHTGQGNIGTSGFGAMIDQNFLVAADVTKGTFSGGHGGLMGGANFRTIGVDDLVRDDNLFGFMGRYSHGTNGIGYNYMGAVAGKYKFDNGGSVGALFGYSRKKISQNYDVGGGGKISEKRTPNPNFDPTQPISLSNHPFEDSSPFNPDELTQKPKSYLFKVEIKPNEFNKAIINYRRYENLLAGRDMIHNNYQLDYNFNPDNELIDIKFLAAYTKGEQKYLDDAVFFGRTDMANKGDLKTINEAITLNLSNKSRFHFDNFTYTPTLGINFLDNEYKNTLNMSLPGATSTPFSPKGRQKIVTFYLDNRLNYSIFEFDANLNLQKWNIKGHKPKCDIGHFCFPRHATDIDKDDLEFNYSFLLSAKIHDLFAPFVSYSKTTRPPNVQEMFFSTNEGNGVNPFLRPEEAKTWQIGFNSFKENLMLDNDRFGLKVLYYNTHVDDYIYNKSFYTTDAFMLHLNQTEVTKFRGWEVELSYDTGMFYVKGSYSKQTSNQTTNETSGTHSNSFGGYTEITELPKDYARIDVGTRLFDEKLTIGMIAKYTGDAYRVTIGTDNRVPTNDPNDLYPELLKEKLPNIPTIYDFYMILKPNENLTLKFEIQNLFDKNYMDALNAFNGTENQHTYDINGNDIYLFDNQARGRTVLGSFEYKF